MLLGLGLFGSSEPWGQKIVKPPRVVERLAAL